jgi:hypothetical protein
LGAAHLRGHLESRILLEAEGSVSQIVHLELPYFADQSEAMLFHDKQGMLRVEGQWFGQPKACILQI